MSAGWELQSVVQGHIHCTCHASISFSAEIAVCTSYLSNACHHTNCISYSEQLWWCPLLRSSLSGHSGIVIVRVSYCYCEGVILLLWGCHIVIARVSYCYCEGVILLLWGCRIVIARVSYCYCVGVILLLWACHIVIVRVSFWTSMRSFQCHVIHIIFVKNLSSSAVLVPEIKKKGTKGHQLYSILKEQHTCCYPTLNRILRNSYDSILIKFEICTVFSGPFKRCFLTFQRHYHVDALTILILPFVRPLMLPAVLIWTAWSWDKWIKACWRYIAINCLFPATNARLAIMFRIKWNSLIRHTTLSTWGKLEW